MTYDKAQFAKVIAALTSRDYAELELRDQLHARILKNRMSCPLENYTSKKLREVLSDISDLRLYNWFFKTDPKIIARALRLTYRDSIAQHQ